MKTNTIKNLDKFVGTILIPVFETYSKSLVPIEFQGVSVHSKVFYGKKDTHYLVEKYDCTHIFIGLGKDIDYKSLKTIFRRISSKQKESFCSNIALVLPEQFTAQQVEAAISGLYLGTYDLGHFKKSDMHPFLKEGFELLLMTKKDYSESVTKGLKIADAQLEILRLVDLPPNRVTPKYLSNWANETGKKFGFEVEVLGFEA